VPKEDKEEEKTEEEPKDLEEGICHCMVSSFCGVWSCFFHFIYLLFFYFLLWYLHPVVFLELFLI
jgi:hypothetical protein